MNIPFSPVRKTIISVALMLSFTSCKKYNCTKESGEKIYNIMSWRVTDIWKMHGGQSVSLDTNYMDMDTNDSVFFSLHADSFLLKEVKEPPDNLSESTCLPGGYEGTYLSSFDSLQVITIEEFDLSHPAGSDVSDFFILTHKTNFFSYTWDKFYGPVGRLNEIEKNFQLDKFSAVLTQKPENNSARFLFRFFNRNNGNYAITYSPKLNFR